MQEGRSLQIETAPSTGNGMTGLPPALRSSSSGRPCVLCWGGALGNLFEGSPSARSGPLMATLVNVVKHIAGLRKLPYFLFRLIQSNCTCDSKERLSPPISRRVHVSTPKCFQQNKTEKKKNSEVGGLVHQEVFLSKHLWSHRQRRCCSAPEWCSYQNKYGQKVADDRGRSSSLHFALAHLCESALVLQAVETTNAEVRGLRAWRVLFLEDMLPLQRWI